MSTLSPGPELTQMLAALAYTAEQALQRRRCELSAGDGPGSAAVRRAEQLRRRANPPVRILSDTEAAGSTTPRPSISAPEAATEW